MQIRTNDAATGARIFLVLQVLIWLINGLYCKVLGLVPRHEAIVGRILGPADPQAFTQLIGSGEILLSIWIATRIRRRLAVSIQIVLVAVMNILEAVLVPDLLLFGYGNAVLALTFIGMLYWSMMGCRQPGSVEKVAA